ncbi:hypothetical protein P153DRAFT_196063 [Dothidotthia symphoricarpi CBS 119687]|uniref:Uncharacterized protein n=1 Tax=Dothidotthia symphoricarpi CBS 119687 TaxID=1392245 RepID=A0A6A6ALW5_9PLEO|nr:uncharacterized protein P153DRAFT_196063 [Dothidotthia symphoricarpi CBS 119687]KAF2131471.1 hypothetical protein P153DRAFT_196063 [Dothidotthia symphoricarpi CBS 119687]
MATRQKSFFDQSTKPKQFRGQWHRPGNLPRHHSHPAPPARHIVTGPPIMPSTQTRSKLKAFQFIEGAPSVRTAREREAEKENLPALEKASKAKETPKTSKTVKEAGKPFETPNPPTTKTCPPPSTPNMRLPLADLVGNIDDSSRHAVEDVVSPEEQLSWRGSQPVNTPLPRKTNKRARSSSPVGPSQDDLRLDSAKRELTTPQADPAMELWSRYTSNKGTPSAIKSVAFAHLINEASPRSTVAAGSVNGLRRWASCGTEFPASTRKRRRTHAVFQGDKEASEDVFAAAPSSDGDAYGQPTKPNLASMVQRMRECVKSKPSPIPSSSTPLPETTDPHQPSSGSPLQRRAREQDDEISETLQVEIEDLEEQELLVEEEDFVEIEEQRGSSDEFGDDDFDTDMVEALDTSPSEVEPSAHPKTHSTIPTEPIYPPPQHPPHETPLNDLESEDEFGLDDEDDADLTHVASLFDDRPIDSPFENQAQAGTDAAASNAAPPPVISLVDDDSDDFGDDIGDDEFAAAEVAATQTPTTTSTGYQSHSTLSR